MASPFDQYQRWRDETLLDWREANARVGEIGGWRTYARESQPSGAATPGQPSAKPGDQPNTPPAGNPGRHGQ